MLAYDAMTLVARAIRRAPLSPEKRQIVANAIIEEFALDNAPAIHAPDFRAACVRPVREELARKG